MTNVDESTELATMEKLTKPPSINMCFSSIQEAENYYKEYGRSVGFYTRRRSSYATLRGPLITRVIFVCSCEGIYKSKPNQDDGELKRKRNSSTMRTGCKAMVCIALDIKLQTWYINKFTENHNHEMISAEKRHLMRSNKLMSPAARSLPNNKQKPQVPKVASLSGDRGSIGLVARDVDNHLRADRESLIDVGDAEAVMNYFKKRITDNPGFYYAVQVDKAGRARNLFWVDARSRIAYSRFGDVVSFDTTCRTNKYSMPFAPFTGMNHHRQSVTFGFALLGDETENTFTWLFETWLEAMGGRPPVSILTDQDQAMTNAIATVFPNTCHRFCLWHIKKKFGEKLSHVFFKKSKFKKTVKAVTRYTYTIEDFESKWHSMLIDFDLTKNAWLGDLFVIREKWIPVYNRGTFFAGMNLSERSEIMDSFFDVYVNSRTSLREFVESCDQALERMYLREREEDYKSIYLNRILTSHDLLVKHASEIYTRVVFNEVQKEFNASLRYRSDILNNDGDEHTYRVYWKMDDKVIEEFIVKINEVTKKGICDCHNFESVGILCRHLHYILVFRFYVIEIPLHFILERWTKKANRSEVLGFDGSVTKDDNIGMEAMRISHYCRLSTELAYMVGKSAKAYDVAMDFLNQAFEKAREIDMVELGKERGKDIEEESCTNIEPCTDSIPKQRLRWEFR